MEFGGQDIYDTCLEEKKSGQAGRKEEVEMQCRPIKTLALANQTGGSGVNAAH